MPNPHTATDPLGLMGCGNGSTPPWINADSLPAAERSALDKTVQHIDSGTVPTDATAKNWGIKFQNKEGNLPGDSYANSPYREYRAAPPPGTKGAGTLRVVTNSQTGEMYYTWSHYGQVGPPAFVRIR